MNSSINMLLLSSLLLKSAKRTIYFPADQMMEATRLLSRQTIMSEGINCIVAVKKKRTRLHISQGCELILNMWLYAVGDWMVQRTWRMEEVWCLWWKSHAFPLNCFRKTWTLNKSSLFLRKQHYTRHGIGIQSTSMYMQTYNKRFCKKIKS